MYLLWILLIPVIWLFVAKYWLRTTYYDKGAREDGKRKVITYADKYSDKVSEELHFFLWLSLIIICATGFLVIF